MRDCNPSCTRPSSAVVFRPLRALPFVVLLGAASLLGGCGKLQARFEARDAVDLFHKGQYLASAHGFESAVRLDPTMPTLQRNLGTAYLAVFREAGNKTPEEQTARQAAATGAINAFQRYLELVPSDERVRLSLVQTFVDTGRYEDAVAFFRPLTDKQPPDPQALATLATVASKTGRPADARKWLERRVAAQPDSDEAHYELGVALWSRLHDHPELPKEERAELVQTALSTLEKAIALKPAAPNAYTYVNLVYREQAQDEATDDGKRVALEKARDYYQKALERQKAGK